MILKIDLDRQQFERLVAWTTTIENHWLRWVDEEAARRGPPNWFDGHLVTVLSAKKEGGAPTYHVDLEVQEDLRVEHLLPNPHRGEPRQSLMLWRGSASVMSLQADARFPSELPYYLARVDGSHIRFSEPTPYLASMLGAIAGRMDDIG